MRVLIPENIFQRNVLAAVRVLGRAGHEVTLAMPYKSKAEAGLFRSKFASRFAVKITNIRSPRLSPSDFTEDLHRLFSGQEFDVLLPFTHASVLPISYSKEALSEYVHIPIAEYSILRRAHDKLETVKVAQEVGVSTPATFHPKSRDDLFSLQGHLPFPCLVKARQGCGIGATIRFATNFEELVSGYDEINSQVSVPPVNEYSLPIIQEYVPGQIHDALYLYSNGECKAALTQERVIMYPVHGGTGAVNQTTNNPELLQLGKNLLDNLGWHGPAQVEFRLDPRDGKYKLLEINPKFWGTLALSMKAGINFPKMACELAVHGDVEPVFDYRVGVTHRWLFPDELYTLVQDRKRLGAFLRFWEADTYYDWDIRDPLPDLLRVAQSIWMILFRRKRILPVRHDLNTLALKNTPMSQVALSDV